MLYGMNKIVRPHQKLLSKVWVRIGPSNGIGAETARVLAIHGVQVVIAKFCCRSLIAVNDIGDSIRAVG